MDTAGAALFASFRHYHGRIAHLLRRVAGGDPAALSAGPFPGTFPAGEHLAIALTLLSRGPLQVCGIEGPDFPERFDSEALEALCTAHADALIGAGPDRVREHAVTHTAGQAEITQAPYDYLARFILPNMIFHVSMAYAALKQAGLGLGKADFDGMHVYAPGFRFPASGSSEDHGSKDPDNR